MNHIEAGIELEVVLNTMVDAAIIIDDRGVMKLFNPASEKVFGYSQDEVIGKNVSMLMPEPFKSEHDGYIAAYQKTHKPKIIGIGREVDGLRKDGSTFHMSLAVGEAQMKTGSVYVGVIRDLTEEYRQREKYESLQQQHFHLSRVSAMNEMGAAIAHELNQPMTAAINYLEAGKFMVDQGRLDQREKFKQILDNAITQTKRASDIIARLRQFIRTGDLDRSKTALKPCLETACDLALMPFKNHGIEYRMEIPSRLPPVFINNIQIQQVVVNLVKNACEAMVGSDEKTLTVSAELQKSGGFVEVLITDTGNGIAGDKLQDLFTPFSTEKTDGMGLGLSISHSIVKNHGGQIWASTNMPAGTRFYFTVPVAEAN